MQAGTLLDTPFQVRLFLAASLINIIADMSNLVSLTIRFFESLLSRESPEEHRPELEVYKHKTIGKVVGFLEKEIYLYALVAQVQPLIGSVLVFKAFTGWIRAEATARPSEAAPSGEAEDSATVRTGAILRFYTYAIGNFVSLLWALGIFEFLHWLIRACGCVRSLIWIQ